MRPLIHPTIDNISVEGILHALSDPVRVSIYANMAQANCAVTCSSYLRVSNRDIPKSTLSQHFKALREAGLVYSERRGVEMLNSSRCKEIDQRFPGLLSAILKAHCIQAEETNRVAKRKGGTR